MFEYAHWDSARLDREIARLSELLEDLKTLQRDQAPSPAVLKKSPTLEGWKLSTRPVPCLAGVYLDHPTIPSGYIGVTSELIAIDVGRGFARTRSRFYALGQPAPKE